MAGAPAPAPLSPWDAFDGRPHQLRMGLRPLDPAAWTTLPAAPALGLELDRRAALLDPATGAGTGVIAVVDDDPDVAAAASELCAELVAHLVRDHPTRYRLDRSSLVLVDDGRRWDVPADGSGLAALRTAGLVVTEDWCLVRPGPPPRLAGGVVCAPNRWRLADKLGRPITDIHDPVPGYRARLAPPVDAVLTSPRGPTWRRNWSIQSSPSRYQPVADGPEEPVVPDQIWVRSEHETLVRLPACGWWVFGIHTTIRPLAEVGDDPALAGRVLRAVTTLDEDTARYKDLAGWRAPLERWLGSVAGRGGPGAAAPPAQGATASGVRNPPGR